MTNKAQRAYIERHPDRIKESNRSYYERNSEKIKARVATRRELNPSKMAAENKLYRETKLDKNAERARGRKKAQKRRAIIAQVTVENVDPAVVLERDAGVCYLCGWMVGPEDWHMEHKVPISKGGDHSYANVAVSHPVCNLRKGTKVFR